VTSQHELACALCGHRPKQDETNALRVLGAEPVSVMVCTDLSACVSRFDAGVPDGAGRVGEAERRVPA
jgi:hypothetical protein